MTSFYKLSGAGNDFIALLGDADAVDPDRIRAWCRRGLSLGADGVIALAPQVPGVVTMRHWNADGGRSELCLNGSRCAARLAGELGWDERGHVRLATDAGRLECWIEGDERVSMVLPLDIGEPAEMELETPLGKVKAHALDVGVPHLVVPLPEASDSAPDRGSPDRGSPDRGSRNPLSPELAAFDIAALGPTLRSHADLGDAGANVDFVRYLSRRRFELRTWERGVEGETLACGTGAVAAARVGVAMGELELPATGATAGGFELEVGRRDGHFTLAGDARLVARGELLPGSLA